MYTVALGEENPYYSINDAEASLLNAYINTSIGTQYKYVQVGYLSTFSIIVGNIIKVLPSNLSTTDTMHFE